MHHQLHATYPEDASHIHTVQAPQPPQAVALIRVQLAVRGTR